MYSKMLSPIKIGSIEIKNRFVMPPMDNELPNADGTVSDAQIAYYEERAKGGYGLLFVDYTTVNPYGRPGAHVTAIWDDSFIPGLTKLTEAVHKHDAKVFIQLHHAGRVTAPVFTKDGRMEACTPIAEAGMPFAPQELTTEEIYERIADFGDAAVRAKKAGFDGVEIHSATCYLLAGFVSPHTNRRVDEFGGGIEGRTRIMKLIIEDVKKKCGQDYPVSVRFTGNEHTADGTTIVEGRILAKLYETYGADVLSYHTGQGAETPRAIASSRFSAGTNLIDGEEIKKWINIPLLIGGRINEVLIAEDAVENGRADMIVFGRSSLADPELPNKVAEGRTDEINYCVGCMGRCTDHLFVPGETISCMANPFCGKETWLRATETAEPKNVVVVGAGPAGLEAAWVAAKRGHKVTLIEKNYFIGGLFKLAAVPPYKQELTKVLRYQYTMCKKYGVDIRMETEATKEMILSLNPDTVILATGSTPVTPRIDGVDGENVVQSVDVLAGKVTLTRGNVLVVGGGEVALELTEFLAENLNQVTVVEMLDRIAPTQHMWVSAKMMPRLQAFGVQFMTSTKVTKITADGAVVEVNGEEKVLSGYSKVVLSVGSKSYRPLEEELKDTGIAVHVIGDAKETKNAVKAIEAGAILACEI